MDDEIDVAIQRLKDIQIAGGKATKMVAELSHTVTSKRKLFSVTVGGGGELQGFTFNGENYRSLAPAELAQMIIDTVAEAHEAIRDETSNMLSNLMPEIGEEFDLLSSSNSLDELLNGFVAAPGSGFSEAEAKAFKEHLRAPGS
jgi:DNA-binding protein YbaB